MTASANIIRRRPPGPPVYLLEVDADHGSRTRVGGVLWDGVLNASPEDSNDGPSPVEALLAGVGACLVRNLRWIGDGAHVTFRRLHLRLAAERDDDPPALRAVRVEVEVETDAPAGRVAGIVERALRSGTITRTVARATDFELTVTINGEHIRVTLPDWRDGVSSTATPRRGTRPLGTRT